MSNDQPQHTPAQEAAYRNGYRDARRALARRTSNAPLRPSRKAQQAYADQWTHYLRGWAQAVREDLTAQADWNTPYIRGGQP